MVTAKDKDEDKNKIAVLGAAGLPAELAGMLAEDAGRGVASDPNEVGIPFVYILQDMSPQVKERNADYVSGAKPGLLFNNVTKEIYSQIEFIPCMFEAAMVEWKPDRGGFAGKHPADTPLKNDIKLTQVEDKLLPLLPNGNLLQDTKYYYGWFRGVDAEGEPLGPWEMGVIGMASSMIANSREWQALMRKVTIPNSGAVAPSFSSVYGLGTKLKTKNNNEWFVWTIVLKRWVTGEEYAAAKEFAAAAEAGKVKVSSEEDAVGAGAVDEGADVREQVL